MRKKKEGAGRAAEAEEQARNEPRIVPAALGTFALPAATLGDTTGAQGRIQVAHPLRGLGVGRARRQQLGQLFLRVERPIFFEAPFGLLHES